MPQPGKLNVYVPSYYYDIVTGEYAGEGDPDCFPVDTEEQIAQARKAMRAEGVDQLRIFVGDGPDSYPNGQILFAP